MTAAARFRALHTQGLFRLANAWDAGTARLIEHLGAPAVATTSAGLAWAQGYPDGHALDVDALVNAVSSITRVIRVPLTVDVEGGYSDDPAAVAATVLRVVRAGAAGINLEDGAGDPARLAAKIQAIREACVAHDLDVFINARTDVYLRSLVAENARIDETLALAALERLGVRRISTGSALAESMYGQLAAQVDTFLHADTTPLPDPQAMGYGAINGLFG